MSGSLRALKALLNFMETSMYFKPLKRRLWVGQTTIHLPHLMHLLSSTSLGCSVGMAPTGHNLAQRPHSLQVLVPEG